tara:strand:- start:193 stop:456 length:264 start_codon:yes stop_codon:yes gene_type:complete
MNKVLNILMIVIIFIFFFFIFKYYSSNSTINVKNYNRSNIDQILKDKSLNLPTLENDTDNIIEFNDSIEKINRKEKKRSFWDLMKNK